MTKYPQINTVLIYQLNSFKSLSLAKIETLLKI